jgi:dihydroxyacetone kinase-like protein
MYRRVHETLEAQGMKVYFAKLGEFATSMDMIGASISVMKLDDELKKYLSPAADTPFIHQNAIG